MFAFLLQFKKNPSEKIAMIKEPHTCIDFNPWIADGVTRDNANGKEEKRHRRVGHIGERLDSDRL
jgi:hypothetical protein